MKKTTWIWLGICVGLVAGGLCYRHVALEVDWRGTTRLMRALEENDVEKTRFLLEKGADINARDKTGLTALSYAARYATEPVLLHKLIVAGADPFAKDKHGYTPLMIAAQYNTEPAIIWTLVKQSGFTKEQLANKNQALLLAARHNTIPIIKTLLIAHASPTATDHNGKNAAALLAENEVLSEQEKTDWRQIMLMLEVVEARQQFGSLSKLNGAVEKRPHKKDCTDGQPVQKRPTAPPTEKQLPLSTPTPAEVPDTHKQVPAETAATSPLQAEVHPTSAGPLVQLSHKDSTEATPNIQKDNAPELNDQAKN